ncbi:MAG: hypothetical protein AAF790_13410, partial [Planctomycetota bacterium]
AALPAAIDNEKAAQGLLIQGRVVTDEPVRGSASLLTLVATGRDGDSEARNWRQGTETDRTQAPGMDF